MATNVGVGILHCVNETIGGLLVALMPTVLGAAASLALFAAMVAGLNEPTYALNQSLVQVRMRGTSMSTLVVLLNLMGMGVGPALAGALSDHFAASYGSESVRWAMVCLLMLNLPAVVLSARAARWIRANLKRAQGLKGHAGHWPAALSRPWPSEVNGPIGVCLRAQRHR